MRAFLSFITNLGIEHANSKIDIFNQRILNQYSFLSMVLLICYTIIGAFIPGLLNAYTVLAFGICLLMEGLVLYLNYSGRFKISLGIYIYYSPVMFCGLTLMYGLKTSIFVFFLSSVLLAVMNSKKHKNRMYDVAWCFLWILLGIWGSYYSGTPFAHEFLPIEDLLMTTVFLVCITYYLYAFFTEYLSILNKLSVMNRELAGKNKELEDFANIVSHDLKAPLRGVSYLAYTIQRENKDVLEEKSLDLLTLLQDRVMLMGNLIDGVLRYSKISSIKESRQALVLSQIVPDVVDFLAPPANFEITIADNLPTIENEPTKIRQVFQNFISNSIKYNDKETGKIEISSKVNGDFYEFCIADNGPGIPERFHDTIFQIFKTGAQTQSKNSTGVGLSIIKKIIHKNDGKLWLESEVGKGTKFFFTLPIAA